MKFTKDNSFFLCHRCFYTTHLKNDMTKHYERKTICDLKYVSDEYMTPKEYYDLSVKKRYFFYSKLPTFISNSTYIKLIKEYHNNTNYIDFYSPSLNPKVCYDMNGDISTSTTSGCRESTLGFSNTTTSLPIEHSQELSIVTYTCDKCNKVFKRKDTYMNHVIYGTSACEKTRLFNLAWKKKREEAEHAKTIIYQIQNVQNIQNNNNQIQNDNHNNIDLSLRDFAKEGYSIDHINVSDLKDDFYLYDNMAELVFQNDVNKNVFFQDKVAIVYTSNRIDVLPTDKAVFHIHHKMGRAADRLVDKHSPAKRKDLANVEKYYRINSDKFCHDTLYKKYDVKEKCYVHDSDVLPGLRTRDECISNVVGIVNAHEEKTQEIFRTKGLNTKKLPPVNPVTIEYFANVKDRYKPLKDDD